MRYLLAIVSLFLCSHAFGADQPASEASVREILRMTNVERLIEGMFPQMEAMMKQGMDQASAELPLSEQEKKAARAFAESFAQKILESMREEMTWAKLEPVYVAIYQRAFTQEEIEGLVAFYKTKTGQALIKKTPQVMQESMLASQQMMAPVLKKMGQAMQGAIEDLKARKAAGTL